MNPPSLTARHEAAHAVVAAHFDLPMCEITIVPSVVEGRHFAGCVLLAEIPEDREQLVAYAATALAARVDAKRGVWVDIPESSYAADDRRVREIAKSLNVPDEKYEDWRSIMLELTSKVLNVACISEAIEAVAYELDKHKTITPEAVMGLLLLFRDSYPKEMQDAQEDIALLSRASQTWREEPEQSGAPGLRE